MEMEKTGAAPTPPTYAAHRPADLVLPAVPQTQPVVQTRPVSDLTLPNLQTILSPDFHHPSRPANNALAARGISDSPASGHSLPRILPAAIQVPLQSPEAALMSPSETGSAMSVDDRPVRSTSVVSMDDPDVQLAARALSELGNTGFSKPQRPTSIARAGPGISREQSLWETEPLLELFTKAHPWVGGTINGSLNAYSTTKHYSPQIVRYGANVIERNIGAPMANTVCTVGKMTGMNSGLRWYCSGSGTSGTMTKGEGAADEMDLEAGRVSARGMLRRDSAESRNDDLPAYRASKPPSYCENLTPVTSHHLDSSIGDQSARNRSFSNQIIVMTSGLSVALSVRSRSSLRLCLQYLENAAQHTRTVANALRLVLQQYDEARESWHRSHRMSSSVEQGERPKTPEHDEAARRLADIIKTHSDDIWATLQAVVGSISTYAGGALPENARAFVRNQLMSLPQRWQWVSCTRQAGDGETSRAAHRMIAFATEGLDMMSQVSETVRLTLESAEQWLDRVGRHREMESVLNESKDHEMYDADAPLAPRYDEKR